MILIMGACPKYIIFILHNKTQVLLLHLTVCWAVQLLYIKSIKFRGAMSP